MKKIILLLMLSPFLAYSQARLVMNDGAYINISNNAYLVVDNGDANAISTLGSNGGNIISESETNRLKWNIGNKTGNHVVPFTNTDGVKTPMEVNITSAGSSDGNILFSTYRTDDMNGPWPSIVTTMCSSVGPIDASLYVIDRFWIVNADDYTTKPGATFSFAYDKTNEASGSNTITEGNLRAQRFNPTYGGGDYCTGGSGVGSWEDLLLGNINIAAERIENIVVTPTNFFSVWTLTDLSHPLPIELLGFNSRCNDNQTTLSWQTATETNNAYFEIQKSINSNEFSTIGTVNGQGNSSHLVDYKFIDTEINRNIAYYRLKQVDFDGNYKFYDAISSNCFVNNKQFSVTNIKFDNENLEFKINISNEENFQISLYDLAGKLIQNKDIHVEEGQNLFSIKHPYLGQSMYILHILGEQNSFSTKLVR